MSAPKGHDRPWPATSQDSHHTGVGHTRRHFHAQELEVLGDQSPSAKLAVGQLRMLVNVSSPCDHLILKGGRDGMKIVTRLGHPPGPAPTTAQRGAVEGAHGSMIDLGFGDARERRLTRSDSTRRLPAGSHNRTTPGAGPSPFGTPRLGRVPRGCGGDQGRESARRPPGAATWLSLEEQGERGEPNHVFVDDTDGGGLGPRPHAEEALQSVLIEQARGQGGGLTALVPG